MKGYSEYDSSHSKRDAKKTAKELRGRGYGARVVPRKITSGFAKGTIVYEVLKSNKKK
jgi:hypothetical protein